jgi:hypothetical protein
MADAHRPNAADAAAGPAGHLEVHHEESDVNIRAIFGFGGGLMAVAFVVLLVIYVLFGFFDGRERLSAPAEYPLAAQANQEPPEPRLQTNPREDLAEMRAREDEILTTYGWVDRNAGVVRIPIAAAMKLVLERGLPARPANEQPR